MTGRVTVDDRAAFLARFENGVMGAFEATSEGGYHCQAVLDAVERGRTGIDPARNIGTEGGLGGEI
jgi:predicted dehydrogenase